MNHLSADATMSHEKRSFVEMVAGIRAKAVDRFLAEENLSRDQWDNMKWDGWHKLPAFAAMRLTPLGGSLRFVGSPDIERLSYMFQNKLPGKLFGLEVPCEAERRWIGSVETSKGDVDDAAREAITGLLELMYLRATQGDKP